MHKVQIISPETIPDRPPAPRDHPVSRWMLAVATTCALAAAALPARAQSPCFTNSVWSVRADFAGNTSPSEPRSLRGLALSKNGSHVFAGFIQGADSSAIRKIDAVTGSTLTNILIGDSRQPKAVATDDRGYVYVATGASDGQFQIFDGADMSLINIVAPSGAASIGGLSVRKSGSTYYLYVARDSASSATIERYVVTDPMLVQTSFTFGTNGNGKFNVRNINSSAANLTGLEVASDGTIYQTDRDLNLIWSISADYLTVKSNTIARAMDAVLLGDKVLVSRYDSSSSDVVVLRQSDLVQVATIPTGIPRDALPDTGYAGIDITADGRIYLADEVYSNSPATLFQDRILVSSPIPTNIVHTCPPDFTVQCAGLVPAGANSQAEFQALGGTIQCFAATVSYSDGPLTPGPIDGTVLRTYTLTDNYGNVAMCTQTITVDDTTPPSFTCPANFTVKTTSVSGRVVTFSTPVATDNCDPTPVVACAPPSGANFPIGSTTVICLASDQGGNTNSCQFIVTVFLQHNTNFVANGLVPDIDPNGLASTKVVTTTIGYLTDVNVTFHVTNGWNGDLYAYLVHESGFSVLLNRVGRSNLDPIGYGDPGLNVTFDDSSPNDVHNYRFTLFGDNTTPVGGPLTGTWAVDGRAANPTTVVDSDPRTEFLSSFNTLNPNGEWTLFIADLEGGDQSSLVDWGLELCGLLPTPVAILAQSGSQSIQCSSNLTLTVSLNATATLPVTNQWYNNGVAISGASNTNLALTNIHPADLGPYTLVACNMANCVTSAPILLTVVDTIAPNLTVCATNRTICGDPSGLTAVPDFTSQIVASDACTAVTVTQSPVAGTLVAIGNTTVTLTAKDAANNSTNCTAVLTVSGPPTITTQPANQTAPMGNGAVFSVVGSSPFPLTYQWFSNGVAVATGTASSLAVSNVTLANNGDGYRVIVSNCAGSTTSVVAVLTVTPIAGLSFDFNTPGQFTNVPYNLVGNDWQLGGSGTSGALMTTQPFGPVVPFEVSTGGVGVATGGGGLDLAFNTALDQTFIFTAQSYDFSLPGKVLQASIMTKIKVPTAGQRAIQLGFITATNGDATLGNRLQLAGINNTAGLGFMSAILQSEVLNIINPGYRLRAQWRGGNATTEAIPVNSPTNALDTNRWYKFTAKFVNTSATNNVIASSNAVNLPTPYTMTVEAMLQDMGRDGLTPGAIVLASPTATNQINVASNIMCTNIVNLITSNRWFFAIRCAGENGGQDYWDNINVTTQPGPVALVQGLANQTVAQGRNVEFRPLVDGDGPYTYQWFKNGVAISGAGNWKYRTPALRFPADNGAQYSVTVTGPSSSISSTSTVTVVADALAVLSVGSVEGSVIGVRFSQPVDPASAQAGANYTISSASGTQSGYAAQVVANDGVQQYRTNEVLVTPNTPISGVFTVMVANVTSLSGAVMGLAPSNTAAGQVLGLTGTDIDPASIGENLRVPTLPGWEYSFAPGQLTINAGGHDITDLWDGFRFTYKRVTGDFDLKVRIPYQDMVRINNKAGFDARLSLDPASPHVGAFANPSAPGRNLNESAARALWNQATVAWGNNQPALFYPNAWLRLRRAGNTFIRYTSTNGVSWTCDGQVQSTGAGVMIPDTLYVGLANNCSVGAATGSSTAAQQYKLSQLDNYGDFAGYTLAVITNLAGPSNITVNAGSAATFTNTATLGTNGVLYAAAGELVYLWQRTNTAAGGWTNMPTGGQTNAVLNTGALWGSDNGAMFRVILMAPGASSVTSSVAVVTVNDGTLPTVTTSVAAPLSPNQIVLNFSELLDAATALNAANYTVTNGLGAVVAVTGVSFMNGDRRVVVITVANPLPGGTNFVRISGVKDLGNQTIATTFVAAVQSAGPANVSGPQMLGPVVMEFYENMPSFGGVGDMVNRNNYRRNFPGGELALPNGSPDFIMYSNVFGIHPSAAAATTFPTVGWGENYGARFYSYFKPSVTAAYKFYSRADDFAEFWINTNAVNSTLPMDIVIGFNTNSPVAQQAWMCMDGIKTNYANSKYLNFDFTGVAGTNTGFYVFPAIGNTVINGMRFWAGGDVPARDPLTFTLSGSMSTTTNGPWTVIASGNTGLLDTGGSAAPANTGRYMPGADANFVNTTAYRSYRLAFTTVRTPGTLMQIGEVEFLNNGDKVLPSGAFLAIQTLANNGSYTAVQNSSNMTLNAGQLYYMEMRYKETGGGDGGAVAVRTDATLPGNHEVISNQFLVFPTNLAPVSTPVQIEIYSALATLNPLSGAGGWNASGNGSILDLLNALTLTNYIAKIPNIVGYGQHFGFNTNKLSAAATMDNYLGRIYANYIAPSNGLYKFYVAVDDTAQLLMNTNAVNSTDPAGARLLGQIINFTGRDNQNIGTFRQVQGGSGVYNLLAENVALTGGQRYYIEARWRDGGGGDGIQVAVRGQGDCGTEPLGAGGTGAEVIPPSQLEMANYLLRWGPIKLGGIQASVNSGPAVLTNLLVLNEGDVVTYNAVDVSGAGSYQGSVANAAIATTTATASAQGVSANSFAANPLSTMGLVWLRNGTDLAKNQLFSSQMYYVSQPVTFADNGSTLSLLVSNTFSTAIQTVTLMVNQDLTPPLITFASGSQYGNNVTLTFSEPVDSFTAQCLANYRIPGLTIFSAKRDDVQRNRVSLQTSLQTPGQGYTVTVNGVRDVSVAGNPTVNATKSFTAWGAGGIGGVYVELFTNMPFGAIDQFLQTSPKYLYNMPDITYYTNNFGAGLFGADSGLNFYAARVSALFMPPSNGLYRFFVRGDDATQLYMNTNGPAPAGRVLIARNDVSGSVSNLTVTPQLSGYQTGTGLGGDNSRSGASISPILSLTNGTAYWVEAIMMEGTGSDYLEVLMRAINPATLTEIGGLPLQPAAGLTVSGGFFSAPGNPDLNKLLLAGPPADQFLANDSLANLTVTASTMPASLLGLASFQWQRGNGVGGFTNLPGGNIASVLNYYVTPADDGVTFRLLASIPGTNAVVTTTLHVTTPDTTPPYIVSASSLNGTNIDVCFSEPVEGGSAIDGFSYSINGGLIQVLTGVVRPDRRTVSLFLDLPLGGAGTPFTIRADNVFDLAGVPSAYETNGVVQGLIPLDVNAPPGAGSSFSCKPGEIDVIAGGADIWSTADQGHLTLRPLCGNFDVWARVQSLSRGIADNDGITKAGLIVRETFEPGARKVQVLVEPPSSVGGRDFYEAGQRPNPNGNTAAWFGFGGSATGTGPAGIPNAWVRIKRTGNRFNAFRSVDGSNWVQTTTHNVTSFSNSVYVGLGTTAHVPTPSASTTFAEYRNVHIPFPPTITLQPSPTLQTVGLHQIVSYTVAASNPADGGPLLYQWRLNGLPIAGATAATYAIANTGAGDTGIYTVDVYNDGGCDTNSQAVQLIVTNRLPIASSDMIMPTQNLALTFNGGSLLANDSDPDGDPAGLIAVSGVAPVTFSSDFNSGAPAGLALYGALVDPTGGVNDSGVLKINNAVNNAAGAAVLDELTPGKRVSAFTANFTLRIGDGSAQPADGFNFSFGGDVHNINSTSFGENGPGNLFKGLSFVVDNYQFIPLALGNPVSAPGGGTANTSGLKLQYGNFIIAGVATPSPWSTTRHVPVSITVEANGRATVLVDGTNVFGNVILPNYVPRAGHFAFYGRCGGENENHWVDNLSITVLTVETARTAPGTATTGGNAYIDYGTGIGGSGALHLTDTALYQSGSYIIPELTPGKAVASFTASFGLRIAEGSANAADGFSFNLAADLPTITGPLSVISEEGAGTGLSLCIDNYPTAGVDTPSFKLKLGGVQLGLVKIPKWSSTAYIPVTMTLTAGGALTVNVDGTNVVAGLPIPYTPSTGRFGLYARTGGEFQTHWVDNLVINATAVDASTGVHNNNFDVPLYGTVTLSNGLATYVPPPGQCGMDTFYYVVSDGQSGGLSVGQVNVQIKEAVPTAPIIVTCPTNRTLNLAPFQCQTNLPDLTVQLLATDNCCCLTYSQSPPAGTPLSVGSTTVTFTVTDTMGSNATCQAVVTVRDVTPPTIVCSSDVTANCTGLGTLVGYSVTAADDCLLNTAVLTCVPASGSLFPAGVTTVNCSAHDGLGNTNTCSFLVTVAPYTADFAVGLPVPDNNANGYASTKTVATPVGILTDLNVRLNISGGYNGDLYAYLAHESGFSVLLNRVGRSASDPLGYADSGFNLTIDDQAASGDVHVYRQTLFGNPTTPLDGPLTNSWAPDGRATDPGVVLDTDARTQLLSSFNGLNPNGEWTLYLADLGPLDTATLVSWGLDFCGLPPIPPSITTPPQSQTVACSSTVQFTVVPAGTPPFTNQWTRNGVPLVGPSGNTLTLPSVSVSDSAAYRVIVRNMGGSVTSAPALLVVIDLPPTITCPANITTECAAPAGTAVSFTVGVSDDCTPGIVPLCVPPSGSVFPPGLTPVNCSATDYATNTVNCAFTVRVVDTTAPTLCNTPPTVSTSGGIDNFSGPQPASPSSNLLYRLSAVLGGVPVRGFDDAATDGWFAHSFVNVSMFAADATLRVRMRAEGGVSDNDTIILGFAGAGGVLQPPQWSRSIGQVGADPGLYGTPWTPGTVNEFVLNLRALPNANGTTTDLLPAIRERGYLDIMIQDNSSVDYVILQVRSCQCDADLIRPIDPGFCGAVVNFPLPPFTDLCDTNPLVVCNPPAGTFFAIGTNTVTCTASDHSGNTNTCGFRVVVQDVVPTLTITHQGTNVVICWPATCALHLLEVTSDLNPVVTWSQVATPPVAVGNQYCVTLPIQPGNHFYRLRRF